MLAIIAIVIVGSWSQVASASPITSLGTLNYNSYLQVDITFPTEVSLIYVYSSVNNSAVTVQELAYIPDTQTTRYLFTSNLYFPQYWEKLGTELFIYQDANSLTLYSINLDLSSIVVPEDPWKISSINATERFNMTHQELNITIANLTATKTRLDNLILSYTNASSNLNLTESERNNLTSLLQNESATMNSITHELNGTRQDLQSAMINLTVFQRFYDEMNSYTPSFDFIAGGDERQYTTIYQYEQTITDKNGQIGRFPLILVFAILVTIIVCTMITYRRWGKKRSSPEALEILGGVDQTTTLVNRFKSRLPIMPKNVEVKVKEAKDELLDELQKRGIPTKPEIKEEIKQETKPISVPAVQVKEDKHDEIKDYVDGKLNAIEAKIEQSNQTYQMMSAKLDRLLAPTKKATQKA